VSINIIIRAKELEREIYGSAFRCIEQLMPLIEKDTYYAHLSLIQILNSRILVIWLHRRYRTFSIWLLGNLCAVDSDKVVLKHGLGKLVVFNNGLDERLAHVHRRQVDRADHPLVYFCVSSCLLTVGDHVAFIDVDLL